MTIFETEMQPNIGLGGDLDILETRKGLKCVFHQERNKARRFI
jgi:hypothetical protein